MPKVDRPMTLEEKILVISRAMYDDPDQWNRFRQERQHEPTPPELAEFWFTSGSHNALMNSFAHADSLS